MRRTTPPSPGVGIIWGPGRGIRVMECYEGLPVVPFLHFADTPRDDDLNCPKLFIQPIDTMFNSVPREAIDRVGDV